jgi:electron transfer flavoprotein alpha subunit
MSVLVIAEHDQHAVHPASLSAIRAAQQLGEVTVLVIGNQCNDVALSIAKIAGLEQVLLLEGDCYQYPLAEVLAVPIVQLATDYTHIIATATSFGKNLMPRVAALLDVSQLSDIIQIISDDTFKRPIYAGNAVATLRSDDPIKVITVRETAFDAVSIDDADTPINILTVTADIPSQLSRFINYQQLNHAGRPDLSHASIVVAGGRGMQSKANFQLIEALADQLGAAVGATRAAVDAEFVSNDQQIGQTGKIIAPKLYIAVAISGAIQHLAGVMDSQVIVAINKDENAPILKVADYRLLADWKTVLPELIERLSDPSVITKNS